MVISFSKLGRHGRIGNQLFQIMSTLGIAQRQGLQGYFPAWSYEQYFDLSLPHGHDTINQYKEEHFHYYDLPQFTRDTDLFGYFQSEKYFPKDFKLRFKRAFTDPLKEHIAFKKPTIAVHIRRTDYVNHSEYYQLPIHWFISALTSIEGWKDHNIIFVSDDLPYCKVHFECLPNAFFIPGNEVQHLMIMSLCDKHVISNSSYAWWGAWLSGKNHVLHSGKMFRGKFANNDIKDYYPERWTVHEGKKVDAKDCTFTIPVFLDHNDRKKNLDLAVCMLQKDVDTNIMIGEQGGQAFKYMEQWAKYMVFPFKKFHRTKMLNDMALEANTPYIANWDCDIFIPPMQVYQSMEALRGGVDVTYPYDGRFARMERIMWWKKLELAGDIGIVRDAELSGKGGKPVPVTSVGGAVLWNKESFIDAGMENEKMISFGPEDVERWERMHTLRLNIHRAGGCLYHMNHWCGPDSMKQNPFFAANHAELNKIRKMKEQELREYIDTFPWRHIYTDKYYKKISEGSIRSAKEVYKALGFEGGSVIDVGCGVGEWSLNNPKYVGIDFNVPSKNLLIPKEQYQDINLEENIYQNGQIKYDLCLCLEVAEHISPERAEVLVAMICNLSDKVFFSAAIPNQGGTGHVNERWQTYWARLFAKNDFYPSANQPNIRRNKEIEMWYRQNAILYTHYGEWQGIEDYVLPEYYEQIVGHLKAQV